MLLGMTLFLLFEKAYRSLYECRTGLTCCTVSQSQLHSMETALLNNTQYSKNLMNYSKHFLTHGILNLRYPLPNRGEQNWRGAIEWKWQSNSVTGSRILIMYFIVNCNKAQRRNSVKKPYIYSKFSKITCILQYKWGQF